MMRRCSLWIALAVAGSIGFENASIAQSGGDYVIVKSTIGGGVGTTVGGVYSLSGTVGQPDAETLAGGDYTVEGGFWESAPSAPACGDGVVDIGETCDDNNLTDGDGCDSNCTATGCGNAIVTAGEGCDDGNLVNGDGCSNTCQVEPAGCPCTTAADCKNTLCAADNACNCASCVANVCVFTCTVFGNANCSGGVSLDDILCSLAGFANFADCPNGDIAPCGGNGILNLDDILAVLNAFGGGNPCGCLGGGAPDLCGSSQP